MASGESVTLLNFLKKEKELYDELLQLSLKQKDYINASHKDFLIKLLNSKRVIIEKIDNIEKALAPLKAKWAGLPDKSEMDGDGRIRTTLNEIQTCLVKMIEVEAENEALMRQMQKKIGEQMKNIGEKKKADKAYGDSAGKKPVIPPRFLDIKK